MIYLAITGYTPHLSREGGGNNRMCDRDFITCNPIVETLSHSCPLIWYDTPSYYCCYFFFPRHPFLFSFPVSVKDLLFYLQINFLTSHNFYYPFCLYAINNSQLNICHSGHYPIYLEFPIRSLYLFYNTWVTFIHSFSISIVQQITISQTSCKNHLEILLTSET